MLEEGDLVPNGKLFNAKLEEGYGGLGGRKITIAESSGRSTRGEEAREAIF